MANLHRDTTLFPARRFFNEKWLLNVYVIKSHPEEVVSEKQMTTIIETHLSKLEEKCMSSEFEYYRTGFAFLHYGNRGVDLTIWHFGRWGSTFETYVCSWYCYNRDVDNLEQLDAAEPILCQYEISLYINEISKAIDLIDCKTTEEVQRQFCKS